MAIRFAAVFATLSCMMASPRFAAAADIEIGLSGQLGTTEGFERGAAVGFGLVLPAGDVSWIISADVGTGFTLGWNGGLPLFARSKVGLRYHFLEDGRGPYVGAGLGAALWYLRGDDWVTVLPLPLVEAGLGTAVELGRGGPEFNAELLVRMETVLPFAGVRLGIRF